MKLFNSSGIELVDVKQTVETEANHRREWLALLVLENGWTHGAEIGLRRGETMFWLLFRCRDLHMIGVDPWAEQPDNEGQQSYTESHWQHDHYAQRCVALANKSNGRARVIRDYSVNAAKQVDDGSLDFVFIDADHNRVAEDIEAWRPKLKPDGRLCGHDINWVSVKTDVDRLIGDYHVGPNQCWLEK